VTIALDKAGLLGASNESAESELPKSSKRLPKLAISFLYSLVL
jgi:hypothetical protein